jgi:excisionase family DNA binding protein
VVSDTDGQVAVRAGTALKLMLTVPEAAAVLGISRSVFYELLLAGQIRSVKIGRARRVPFVVLEEFVTRQLSDQCPAYQEVG